jgi:hypothetical protein
VLPYSAALTAAAVYAAAARAHSGLVGGLGGLDIGLWLLVRLNVEEYVSRDDALGELRQPVDPDSTPLEL